MKKTILFLLVFALCSGVFISCTDSSDQTNANTVSEQTMSRLVGLGFDVKNFVPFRFDKGYLVEGDIYLTDSDTQAQYTTNLQGEIVDVPETNVKPRLNFFDANQMQKSIAEIKPLFGGKLSVSELDIQIENFSFSASDPCKTRCPDRTTDDRTAGAGRSRKPRDRARPYPELRSPRTSQA